MSELEPQNPPAEGEFQAPRKTSFTDFDGIFDIPNPTMPEHLFIRDFLQLMLNPNLSEDLEIAHNKRWIAIAGNPLQSIDVLRGNKIIFTAPPLFSTDKPVIVDEHRQHFKDLLADVKKQSDISPILGDQVLNHYIDVLANTDKTVNPAYAAQWRHILDFYKLTDRVSEKFTGKKAASTPNGNQSVTDGTNFVDNFDADEDA